ncbi:MAG: hypothetical protein HYU66_29565 [Armatimonadetes bacterium]|nr:hypothetical protein [Armatimonadota bacterium]
MAAAYPWTAHWLWATGQNHFYRRFTNTYVFFRCEVTLPCQPAAAPVRVTADTRYRLWVNGTSVNRGPARGYPESLPYDEIDLAPWLHEGVNVLGILAHCIGDYTFQSEYAGRPGVLLDGAAEVPGHAPVRLDTHPAGWQAREGDGYRRGVERSSVQTGWQEDCDLARWPGDWLEPGADPAGWGTPADLGPHPQPPWLTLEPRWLPLLTETEREPLKLAGIFAARQAEGWREVENLSDPLAAEDWQPAPEAAQCDDDAVTVAALPDGRAVAAVFDLGLTCLGHPELSILNASGGVVELAYAERVLPGGFVATRPPQPVQPRLVDRFRLRNGAQEAMVFNPRGFRYVAVIVRDAPGPVTFRWPRLCEIGYPCPQRGALETGEELLDSIWQTGVTTLRRNMTDAYTDCPWREQAQWWGDARVEFLINAHSLGDTLLLGRGVRQGAQSQLANGLLYGVFPGKSFVLPDYNFVWIETLWDHYQHTGSDALLREHAGTLRRCLAWFRDKTDHTGLLTTPEGTWLFLDWAPLYRDQYSTVYNLRYLQALAASAQIFARLGDHDSADACIGRGMLAAMSLTQRVYDPDTGRWHDGWDAAANRRVEAVSAHAQALAILLGLQPESHDRLCREVLIPVMCGECDDVVAPSPFFSAFVLEALAERGYGADVVDIIRRRWGEWVFQGHPTWPEEWHPEGDWNMSLCHAWSGAPTWILSRILLGVRPLEPGWRRVLIAPRRAGLSRVSGKVPAPQGDVAVAWRVEGGTWHVSATVPAGMAAVVDLGDGTRRDVGPGEHQWGVPA